MPLVIPGAVKSQTLDHSLHYWASCWRISLTTIPDRVYRFTDHQENLTFSSDETFQSMDGMDGSATQRKDNLKGVNRDVRGIISDSQITDIDLENGLFTNAYVEDYLVDTRLAGIVPITVNQYWIKAMTFDGAVWVAEVDGITSQLTQPSGDYWGPVCRVEVFTTGPGKCNLSQAVFLDQSTIGSLGAFQSSFSYVPVNALWNVTGYGQDGFCTFVSGANQGLTSRIKTYTYSAPNATIILQEKAPYGFAISDRITLLPGCNKRVSGDCSVLKFNNVVNFQGEPFIPGGDLARRGATSFW